MLDQTMNPQTKQFIEQEQVYQQSVWIDDHTPGEWILILQNILAKAHTAWLKQGESAALREILQLAATAITCLDGNINNFSGRTLSASLQKVWEKQYSNKEGKLQSVVDAQSKKIQALEDDIKELRIRLQTELFRSFPPAPPERPNVPWYPPAPEPLKWEPSWSPTPIITCQGRGDFSGDY